MRALIKRRDSVWPQVLVIILLCLILGLTTSLWLRSIRQDLQSAHRKPNDALPDFFGKQLNTKIYDEKTGVLSRKLEAKSVEHYPVSGKTWLTQPVIWKFNEKNILQLHAVSRKGEIFSDRKTFRLFDHVVITQPASGKQAPVILKTSEMIIDTGNHEAKTEKPVKIFQDGTRVNSTGLKYNYRNNTVELKSNVHGVGQPDT